MNIVLTKVTTPIIGWIGSVLGWIINAIYSLLEFIGIPNIGLAIILFTLVIYIFMTPLQIKQQKFSKLNSIMQPEIQKIQKKYKGKKDQESMMKQNEEVTAVYQKYGVSPTGSCVQLLVQMPILLALYQVIYHIPGYIAGVREVFTGLATKIMSVEGFSDIISKFLTDNKISMYGIAPNMTFTKETTIDFLYKLTPSQMESFADVSQFSGFADLFADVSEKATHMNRFLNLNISDTPWAIIQSGWSQGNAAGYLLVFAAIMIPFLAWFTQWLNYKLMPQPQNQNDNQPPSTMEASMKSMNTVMPIMSAIFCFSFPVGIGIYWIIGAVIRSVQQVVLNKHMDKIDTEDLIRKNQEKMKKKMEKRGMTAERINQQARMNVRNIQEPVKKTNTKPALTAEEKAEQMKKSTEYYKSSNYKPGSLAAKANMVKQFDEEKQVQEKIGGRAMEFREITAKTVDEAITKACLELETSSDNLEIQVVREGTSGFFGIGSKPAIIKVRKKVEEEEFDILKELKKEETKKEESKKERKAPVYKEPKKEVKKEAPKPIKKENKPVVKEEVPVKAEKKPEMKREERKPVVRTEEQIKAMEQDGRKFLEGVFKAMELPVEINMNYDKENDCLEIDFSGEDMGILIGKRGQTLDSLQYLTSLVVNKEQQDYVRVKLDTENYRSRRKDTLENLARNIAYKVKKTRKPVVLEPMNPYERRIIHSALQGNKFVETYSEGNEPYRHVVVVYKK